MPENDIRMRIKRRSAWATAMGIFAGLSVIGAIFALLSQAGGFVVIVLLASALHCALLSFMIDVFTDIRWFLKTLVDGKTTVSVVCPHCHATVEVRNFQSGAQIQCPDCKLAITI
jgi:DNA-directed RNA polymerase subunit RPC12/RpoP